jgi:hypothetical protein
VAQGDQHIIGLDVSKATLDVFEWGTGRAYSMANDATAVEHWLAGVVESGITTKSQARHAAMSAFTTITDEGLIDGFLFLSPALQPKRLGPNGECFKDYRS